jgi:hypothetical protein
MRRTRVLPDLVALVRSLAEWAPMLREPLELYARALIDLLLGGNASPHARKRSSAIGGKGGQRRGAARVSAKPRQD